jgi:hypothetical protein
MAGMKKGAKHGGAGTLVPITGVAKRWLFLRAHEFKAEGYVLGVGAKVIIIHVGNIYE